MKLKEGAVPRVGICEKNRIRQILAQPVGVRDWNHVIVNTIEHESRLADAF